MARQKSAVELNSFVAGYITEASPLTFPDNASLDEENFVLSRDGTRRRRLGLDLEASHEDIATSVVVPTLGELAIKTFSWDNAGGDERKTILVVQIGNEIKFIDTDAAPLSSGLIHTETLTGSGTDVVFSYAVVDSLLVVAAGQADIYSFDYSAGTVSSSAYKLSIRDMFGVEDVYDGKDLRSGSNVSIRPATLSDAHTYNLRNQTWGDSRDVAYLSTDDTIYGFYADVHPPINVFPSNSDVTTYSIFPNTAAGGTADLFWTTNAKQTATGTTQAPRGYFIIDALSRGTSRKAEYSALRARSSGLKYPIKSLPVDSTPGGATVIVEYSGRVFYAGFSGEVIGGDRHSPRLSSYVMFSTLVDSPPDIAKCYQEGDPTSKETPDLVDTDGGVIRIDGAYGISKLVNIGVAVLVVAENGVWSIQGGSDYGFKATNYRVSKLTSFGCTCPESLVQVDNTIIYWADDGIYSVAANQFGDLVADSVSQATIQTFYSGIDPIDRKYCRGIYDNYAKKVYWVYGNRPGTLGNVKELVLDLSINAFYKYTIGRVSDENKLPLLVSGLKVKPYRFIQTQDGVTVSGGPVVVSGDPVIILDSIEQVTTSDTKFLCITEVSPTVSFTFCEFSDGEFLDWKSADGVGVDAHAYLVTGWMTGGDSQRYKQVPSLTFHFMKTEDGYSLDGNGDYIPNHQSSCIVSSQWGWSNSPSSGRWGTKWQAYRFNRHYFPDGVGDTFDNGFQTVVTKNKLRGKGRALSLLIETEPGKDCYLLGWAMVMAVNGTV